MERCSMFCFDFLMPLFHALLLSTMKNWYDWTETLKLLTLLLKSCYFQISAKTNSFSLFIIMDYKILSLDKTKNGVHKWDCLKNWEILYCECVWLSDWNRRGQIMVMRNDVFFIVRGGTIHLQRCFLLYFYIYCIGLFSV